MPSDDSNQEIFNKQELIDNPTIDTPDKFVDSEPSRNNKF